MTRRRSTSAVRAHGLAVAGLAMPCLTGLVAQTTPDAATIRRLVDRLDTAFTAGDRDAYLAAFRPTHDGLHQALDARLRRVLTGRGRLVRETEVLRTVPQPPFAIAHVQSRTRAAGETPLGAGDVVEDMLLVVGTVGEQPFARLQVPVAANLLDHVVDGAFRCEACNYSVGKRTDWLAVPMESARTGCFESVTFFALDGDLRLEVSIHLRDHPSPAAESLLAMLAGSTDPRRDVTNATNPTIAKSRIAESRIPSSAVRPWVPACFATTGLPDEFSAATATLTDDAGGVAHLHLLVTGRLAYLLAIGGRRADYERMAAAAAEQLDSFRLLEPACQDDVARVLATHGHGVKLDGVRAKCDRLGIAFDGPAGWTPRLEVGPFRCRVVYEHPSAGSLRVTAYEPPPGTKHWTRPSADSLIAQFRAKHGGPERKMSPWVAHATPFAHDRTDVQIDPCPQTEDSPACLLTVIRMDDVLLVLDGRPKDAAAREAILGAFDSLRRK
jgi:hypothetical protein